MTWQSNLDSMKLNASNISFFHDILLIVLLFVLVFVGMMIFLVYFNFFMTNSYLEENMLEYVWTVMPSVILVIIFMPSLIILNFVNFEEKSETKVIRVCGHQWNWEYEYLVKSDLRYSSKSRSVLKYFISREVEHLVSYFSVPEESNSNRLLSSTVPLLFHSGKILLKITSDDVIHSFSLPMLGVKLDACPGRKKEVLLGSVMPGLFFNGQCSEICGVFHSNMPMEVVSVCK